MLGERKIEFYGDSQLWALLRLTYEDGTTEDIATGEDWFCVVGAQESEIFNGETFDARRNRRSWIRATRARCRHRAASCVP